MSEFFEYPDAVTPKIASSGPSDVGLRDAKLAGWYREDSGELFRGMPIGAEDVVVDVGCGVGFNSAFCARHGAAVHAIDNDPQMVHQARTRLRLEGAGRYAVLLSGANPLPLEDGMATRVICTEVLQHAEDPQQMLAELVRIGGSGCLYLLSVPGALQEQLQKAVLPPVYREQAGGALRVIGRDDFSHWVTAAGLVVMDHAGSGFFWSMWWALFCGCEVGLQDPAHPVLDHWAEAWSALLETPQGRRLKQQLDGFMPVSEIIIARKP